MSRIVFHLILAIISISVTIANMLGAKLGNSGNILVSIIVLWAAIRAVEATFKLHGRFSI